MPRGRMLSKKISFDEKVAKLSLKAALLYTWAIPHLDVEGRLYAEPEILKGMVVPFIKELNTESINESLKEMETAGLILLYGDDHKYMEFVGFKNNQLVNKEREAPSSIPSIKSIVINSGVYPDLLHVKLNQIKVNQINIWPQVEALLTDISDTDIKYLIYEYLEILKNENKTKTLSDNRKAREANQLYNLYNATEDKSIFKHALLTACSNFAPNINYVKKVIRTKTINPAMLPPNCKNINEYRFWKNGKRQ